MGLCVHSQNTNFLPILSIISMYLYTGHFLEVVRRHIFYAFGMAEMPGMEKKKSAPLIYDIG